MRGADPSPRKAWPELLALVVLTVVVTVLIGPIGVLVGIVTAAFWYGLGVPYALAAGVLVATAVTPGGLGPIAVGALTLAFAVLPVSAAVRTPAPSIAVATVLVGTVTLAGLAWASYVTYRPWVGGAVLLGAVAFATYGLHRYELVRFGLVSDDDPDSTAKP